MIFHFDTYALDTGSLELRKDGDPVPLEPQVFSVLAYLIENRDRVVSKDELIGAVWDGRAISDGALNSRITAVRRAIGDSGEAQALIRTHPRRGFRFVGAVTEGTAGRVPGASVTVQPGHPSIAVLPFANLSGDPEQEYFSDGVTEDLIAALSRFRRFRVVARGSTFSYKGRPCDVRQVGQELNARYILEGSVRRAGGRVRLGVQLSEAESGTQLWADRFDRNFEDVFALQDELTLAILGMIEPALGRAEQDRALRKPPENLDAWDTYQRGMFHMYRRTKGDIAISDALFRRAMEMDPQFALAHSGYARNYYWNVLLASQANDRPGVLAAGLRAVELGPDEAETHLALGIVYFTDRNYQAAIPEIETAVGLNPSYAQAYHMLGTLLVHSGRPAEGIPHILTAIELSPKDAEIGPFHARLSVAHLYLKDYEAAVEWGYKAVRLPGIQWPAYCFLASALAHLGRMVEARSALEGLFAMRPGATLQFVRANYPAGNPKIPARDSVNKEHLLEGLRMAGLPD